MNQNSTAKRTDMNDNDGSVDVEGIEELDGFVIESETSLLRKRIISTLKIYPRVSPSMLQAAIGPHHAPRDWRPLLEEMIREGLITRGQESHLSERGRWRTIVVLSLTDINYSDFNLPQEASDTPMY